MKYYKIINYYLHALLNQVGRNFNHKDIAKKNKNHKIRTKLIMPLKEFQEIIDISFA